MQNPSAIHWRKVSGALALAGLVWVVAVIGVPSALAQSYSVLYSFKGGATDGENPEAGLSMDTAGNLYGTTVEGPACSPTPCTPFAGIAFKLSTTGTETVLHSFKGNPDGANPYGGLTSSYGTTSAGGTSNMGVVFKLDTAGKETVLYNFTGGADGGFPYGGLFRTSAGNIYGTTSEGGITTGNCFPSGCGVVFQLDAAGKENVLYSFTGSPDGANPYGDLIPDPAGNIYGTTFTGGVGACTNGCGVVFTLDSAGTETVLHSFMGYPTDGAFPYAGVIRDSAGNLYGTTAYGGKWDNGAVFKVGTTGTETVLYNFTGKTDGAVPRAPLILDSAGNLYGTAYSGGVSGAACGGSSRDSCGVVFELAP